MTFLSYSNDSFPILDLPKPSLPLELYEVLHCRAAIEAKDEAFLVSILLKSVSIDPLKGLHETLH